MCLKTQNFSDPDIPEWLYRSADLSLNAGTTLGSNSCLHANGALHGFCCASDFRAPSTSPWSLPQNLTQWQLMLPQPGPLMTLTVPPKTLAVTCHHLPQSLLWWPQLLSSSSMAMNSPGSLDGLWPPAHPQLGVPGLLSMKAIVTKDQKQHRFKLKSCINIQPSLLVKLSLRGGKI